MAGIHLRSIRKSFQGSAAVADLNLSIADGEFVSLLGPSGCGKSTTLRMVAGFETPDSGTIHFGDTDVTDIPPRKRSVGMVFQNYSLFPHLTVAENIGYGLRRRGEAEERIRQRVSALLDLVRLPGFAQRYPASLSGGQQQRVALARAVAAPAKVLLMDEPLGALDLKLREDMQTEIRRLHREFNLTTVYVTHDQGEAFALSDRIAVMNAGRIEQIAPGIDLYRRPETEFVARFVGRINILKGQITQVSPTGSVVETLVGRAVLAGTFPSSRTICIAVRPEDVVLSSALTRATDDSFGPFRATVRDILFGGGRSRIELASHSGIALEAELDGRHTLPELGQEMFCSWPVQSMTILKDSAHPDAGARA